MKELSLNVLDIAENSVKAKASLIEITLDESGGDLVISITDNGVGMSEETVQSVIDPFYTTRTTRKVGLGIPLFKFAAEQTGGCIEIRSKHISDFPSDHGTTVSARFVKNHIDCTPLGDIVSTIITLIQGHPDIDFKFLHKSKNAEVALDTCELREVLGDVPLSSFEVLEWIKDNLTEQYEGFN